MYEGYKGQRAACPDAVKEAIPRLQRLLDAMAIPYIQVGAQPAFGTEVQRPHMKRREGRGAAPAGRHVASPRL